MKIRAEFERVGITFFKENEARAIQMTKKLFEMGHRRLLEKAQSSGRCSKQNYEQTNIIADYIIDSQNSAEAGLMLWTFRASKISVTDKAFLLMIKDLWLVTPKVDGKHVFCLPAALAAHEVPGRFNISAKWPS